MEPELDTSQFEEILATLRVAVTSLSHYNLTLYRSSHVEPVVSPKFTYCASRVQDPVSNELARHYFSKDLASYFEEATPSVCRYGGAFFGFVIPFILRDDHFCLVGDGVRDTSIDLWQLAALSRQGGTDVFSLFPHVETLPTATVREVENVARAVSREIARLCAAAQQLGEITESPAPPPQVEQADDDQERVNARLAEISLFLERVDKARSLAATLALCVDTITTLHPGAKLLTALRADDGVNYELSGLWGLPEELGILPATSLGVFLSREKVKTTVPFDNKMRAAIPEVRANLATSFPLESAGERLGFLSLLDCDLTPNDALVVSMLVHGAGSRLAQLLKEAEQARASSLSGRLLSLTNTLLHVGSKDELYKTILEIAADLLNAAQGSIMLIDKNGETMHIVFTKGITLHIAQCLPMKVGKGIAGKVAQTGQPLVVNDVEKDSRVAMINRPRFKSKALICIPLKLKEKVIGVLNLSDKADLAPFTDADLQLLTSFANLASLMIERTLVLEESVRFEQLSVTDSLTGLYNRRFLKSRIEEELNRSNHQGLNLTILFLDLDFFKNYNDICGHLAGDEALKRTADIIQGTLREMDTVARYGGEEFCALLPGTSKAEALIVAERIRAEIESEKFPGEHNLPLGRLTASCGVASFPEDGRTYTALIHASDIALYQAKANGRNQVVAANAPRSDRAPQGSAPAEPTQQQAAAARTFDFNSYLEATESLRQKA
ncbi:diguanylate cyclase [Geomonas limicola]|uniref:diguanylate cyclase n=1 Tax=Geomonas limicola TaxID=2740186 RepID=A0A6V8N1V5_9BACT|nr:sensor domain-containing diguanylate cyclase [Geomonas limicola]GFO66452.1 diguanylate cyclase [Geomonas limicola]